MQVPFVLSNGQSLLTLEVTTTCTVTQLERQLQLTLSCQVSNYMYQQGEGVAEPAAFLLRATPSESLHTTSEYVNSAKVPLFAYGGERLKGWQQVSQVTLPICVLRPTDIETTRYSLSGKKDTVLLNTMEEVTWREVDPSVMELVIVRSDKEPFLCCASATETIASLLVRLRAGQDWQLWHHSAWLVPHLTVRRCGLNHRSRVALQQAGELTALAVDVYGQRAVFPLNHSVALATLKRKVNLLTEEWRQIENLHPYCCQCVPISPYSQRYQVILPNNRLLSLQFPDGRREEVLIPSVCTVKQVKNCIELQHGLPSARFSLTFLGELSFESAFKDLGVENGDNLMIVKKKTVAVDWVMADIYSRYRKTRLCLQSNTTVFQLKERLKAFKFKPDSVLFLLQGSEVLPDAADLAQCGIDENVPLYCGSAEEVNKRLGALTRRCFIPPRGLNCANSGIEQSLELFESGQNPGRLSYEERVGRYEKEVREVVRVRVISPATVLLLNVHTKATITVIKTHLQSRLKQPSFRLLYRGEDLEGDHTLAECRVTQGSDLVLVPPGTIPVTLRTAAGLCFPVVLQPETTLHYLCPVLEKLTGLQFNCQRVLFTKPGVESHSVPAAVDALTALIQYVD